MRITSSSEKETHSFAKKFAHRLSGGETLGLIGNLGAGKTVFTKGLARGLGIKKTITSPTFVLMKVYPLTGHRQIKFLVHIDAYRMKSPESMAAIGALEYLGRPDTVALIEWADKIKKILPKKTKFITFKYNNNRRIITF